MGELDRFRSEVNINLACGAFGDVDLPVVDDDGGRPVVAALEREQLSTVLGRIRSVGGFANLFVLGNGRVRLASVIRGACAIGSPDDDMTSQEDGPDPRSTIGMFLDYVERNPHGVGISATALGRPAMARDSREVDFALH